MIPYKIKLLHRIYHSNDKILCKTDVYRFKTRFNRVYFIVVEAFNSNVYAIKFHLRIHQHLPNKYQFKIDDGDAFRIFSTCISMASIILENDPKASFGFIGQNSIDESIILTQRYRIYNQLAKRYFQPKNYTHHKDEKNSIYFLANKKNKTLNVKKVSESINQFYIFNNDDTSNL